MKKIISLLLVLLTLVLVGCSNGQSYNGEVYIYADEENIVHRFAEISETKIKESVNGSEDVEYVFSIVVEEGYEVLSLYISGQLKWKFIINYDKTLTIFEVQHTHDFIEGTCSCGEKDPNYVKIKEFENNKYYFSGSIGSNEFEIPEIDNLEKTNYILLKDGKIYIGQYNSEKGAMEEYEYGLYVIMENKHLFSIKKYNSNDIEKYNYWGEIYDTYMMRESGNYTYFYFSEDYIKNQRK